MLRANRPKSRAVTAVECRQNQLYLYSEAGTHCLNPVNDRTVRITYTEAGEFSDKEKPGVLSTQAYGNWSYTEEDESITLKTGFLKVVIRRETAALTFMRTRGTGSGMNPGNTA